MRAPTQAGTIVPFEKGDAKRPTLPAGTRVGRYEIRDWLGTGGMGEVYRASDRKLGRDVAVKLPRPGESRAAGRARSLLREAECLAALQHPGVPSLHDLEQWNGQPVLVMEYVPGASLSVRLCRGPLPIEQALRCAAQLSEALAAVHEAGFLHGDIKPGNALLTPEGKVRLVDFGLARSLDPNAFGMEGTVPQADVSSGETSSFRCGTVAYMSPEQLRYEPVDQRADIWSLGCVLYELLTGHRACRGGPRGTGGGILERGIDWELLPAELPAPARALVRRCLEKNRGQRLRDARDIGLWTQEALAVIGQACVD